MFKLPFWTQIAVREVIIVVEALLAGNSSLSDIQKAKLEALLAAAQDVISVF